MRIKLDGPVAAKSPVLALLQTIVQESKAAQAAKPVQFVPASCLALLPAKFVGFTRVSKGQYTLGEKDGFLALLDWPAYTDDDGKTHPATHRVAKFQTSGHVSSCIDETGKVRDGKAGWFSSISREDLALYSGAWDGLISEAKKQGTLK